MIHIFQLTVGIFVELLLLPVYILSVFLGYFIPLTSLNKNPTKKFPIVFVHGWLTQNLLYVFLKRYLEKKGFIVYMTDLGLLARDFNEDASHLKSFIEEKNLHNVVLVGVSGGGIVSHVYLQQLNGWERTRKFISIGSPFKGSILAYLACWFSGSARQMIPNSNFLKKMRPENLKNLDKIVCISAKYDELVPNSSSEISGTKQEIIPTFGHVFLQSLSKETYFLVAKYADEYGKQSHLTLQRTIKYAREKFIG